MLWFPPAESLILEEGVHCRMGSAVWLLAGRSPVSQGLNRHPVRGPGSRAWGLQGPVPRDLGFSCLGMGQTEECSSQTLKVETPPSPPLPPDTPTPTHVCTGTHTHTHTHSLSALAWISHIDQPVLPGEFSLGFNSSHYFRASEARYTLSEES